MTGNSLPDFLIIGAMKAATSTLYMQLAAQPGIFMTTLKEPNFFSDPDRWSLGLDWYRELFASATPGDLRGEASTHYTKLPTFPDALPRILETMPGVRLVYMMRHPLDRLISHFSHGWLEHSIDGPIDAAIERHPELIDYGRYAMQIRPWIEAFGKQAILPVFAERLSATPQQEFERICRHIGYVGRPSWSTSIAIQNVSKERLRDSPWRDRVVDNPLSRLIRRNLIPKSVRNAVKRHWQMHQQPTLGEDVSHKAVEIFDRDLTELGAMLGIPLDCRSFKETVRGKALDWI